jgi:GTP cyclohydrolase I
MEYDTEYRPSATDIEQFPDLQNGPSSLIQGAAVEIQQVGIHNFRLPLKFKTRNNDSIVLETKVTGTVSLAAHKKGINMSRIMRSFYDFKDDAFTMDKLETILNAYQDSLEAFDSKVALKFSYPILKPSLRSDNEGYQYYNVTLEADLDKTGTLKKVIILTLCIRRLALVRMNFPSLRGKAEARPLFHIRNAQLHAFRSRWAMLFGLKIYKISAWQLSRPRLRSL